MGIAITYAIANLAVLGLDFIAIFELLGKASIATDLLTASL